MSNMPASNATKELTKERPWFAASDTFSQRHLGINEHEQSAMLAFLGFDSLETLITAAVPESIRLRRPLALSPALTESEVMRALRLLASKNHVFRSYLGLGYHPCFTPAVIQRNILENPGWYTSYTPYQSEISQGRMEALLNFQTMVCDLTGMAIANASLLDEGTAAAEAMAMCWGERTHESAQSIFLSDSLHPQTIEVIRTRATPLAIEIVLGDHRQFQATTDFFAVVAQYPATDGTIYDYTAWAQQAHAVGAYVIMAADPLALTLLRPPGEFGADVVVGSAQRFGVPMGYGGPHAAYLATTDALKRHLPGRLIGVSKDAQGNPAYRLSLQTREQHIRREKATSNICTAQALLAIMASMYAVYHGPEGLRKIARRILGLTQVLADGLRRMGYGLNQGPVFDTVTIEVGEERASLIHERARLMKMNLRSIDENTVGVTLDETTTLEDLNDLLTAFAGRKDFGFTAEELALTQEPQLDPAFARTTALLAHPVFNTHHTETELLRYIRRLESRDISLTSSMIPLGSCTMKLNATTEMWAVTWPEFAHIHPFAPREQTQGYAKLAHQLETWLSEITGFPAISLQPNAGSQGEYAGLLAIRSYHLSRGQPERTVCLIPLSAHGTNPASAVMVGMQVVPVACDAEGNIDLADLRTKALHHAPKLAALMVTYPSTHGVFESGIQEACAIIHECGGQVYMDGANLNAQVGLCRPGDFGADVCHLNLHKTFCIPHGGGGPGVGPIGVGAHLAPFLPGHSMVSTAELGRGGAVASAPWGSALILTIPWTYIAMLGGEGLTEATKVAILNANYMARRLENHFPVLYRGTTGLVAHECIIDVREWKGRAGIEVEDVAKRLMDYGYHAPTMSWPVAGTLMIEPTESESQEEMDRFCDAMLGIHAEMVAIEKRSPAERANNILKNAPHTALVIGGASWDRPYTREEAAFPYAWSRHHKIWPYVGRVDNVYGDRHLVCTCLPMEEYLAKD
jgi:glycine dehydrogenase